MKKLLEQEAATEREMEKLAGVIFETFLKELPSSLLLLEGELGAGKTAFCRGLGEILEIEENINSPTFNLLNEYSGPRGHLLHYDLYRLHTTDEIEEIGFPEKWHEIPVDDLPRIHAIEWWRRAETILHPTHNTFLIRIDYNLDDVSGRRNVTVYGYE